MDNKGLDSIPNWHLMIAFMVIIHNKEEEQVTNIVRRSHACPIFKKKYHWM